METPLKVVKVEEENNNSHSPFGNIISTPVVLSPTIDTSNDMLEDNENDIDAPPYQQQYQHQCQGEGPRAMTSNNSSSNSLNTDDGNVALHRVDSKPEKSKGRGRGKGVGRTGTGTGSTHGGGGYITKRTADRMTVEGSPLVRAIDRGKTSLVANITEACASSNVPSNASLFQSQMQAAAMPNKKTNCGSTPAAFRKQAPVFSPSRPSQYNNNINSSSGLNNTEKETHEKSEMKTAPPAVPAGAAAADPLSVSSPVSQLPAPSASSASSSTATTSASSSADASTSKVLVISAVVSDTALGHNTGTEHQENELRTKLLTDAGVGCLKTRVPLRQHLCWVEDTSVLPPPAAAPATSNATGESAASTTLASSYAPIPTVTPPSVAKSGGVVCSPSTLMDQQFQQMSLAGSAALTPGQPSTSLHMKGLVSSNGGRSSVIRTNVDIYKAPITDLLRVHDYAYLRHLQNKCDALSGIAGPDPKPQPPHAAPAAFLDVDTPLSATSLTAARRFCGAAMLAVDCVMGGAPVGLSASAVTEGGGVAQEVVHNPSDCERALVLGRPPGHHAGPNGCVASEFFYRRPDMTSSGFCLLNTVAVAAAYARATYGRERSGVQCERGCGFRVAIVDIDVHHGNGTEEIVRNLKPRTTYLPLPSSWAPVSQTSYRPWLDETDPEHVFFSSINLHAGSDFYPCSGRDETPEEQAAEPNIVNIGLTPVGPGPFDPRTRKRVSTAQRNDYCRAASAEFRSKVSARLLPRLREFQPHLLLISSGFDAHYDDMYHWLTEHDFEWVTRELITASNYRGRPGMQMPTESEAHAGGTKPAGYHYAGACKVVSVLEGGYSLSSTVPAESVFLSANDAGTSGIGKTGGSVRNKKPSSKAVLAAAVTPPSGSASADVEHPFAIRIGDGGLVKGMLGHVSALIHTSPEVA